MFTNILLNSSLLASLSMVLLASTATAATTVATQRLAVIAPPKPTAVPKLVAVSPAKPVATAKAKAPTQTVAAVVVKPQAPKTTTTKAASAPSLPSSSKPNNTTSARAEGILFSQGVTLKKDRLKRWLAKVCGNHTKIVEKVNGRLVSESQESQESRHSSDSGKAASPDAPVSFVQTIMPQMAQMRRAEIGGGTVRGQRATVFYERTPAALVLEYGEAVVSAKHNIAVEMGSVDLQVHKGAHVLVNRSGSVVLITNLSDNRKDSVVVYMNGLDFSLRPGQQCAVGNSKSDLQVQRKNDGCGRRAEHTSSVGDKVVSVCEISIPSLLISNSLASVLYVGRDRDDVRISNQIIRMAACVSFVRGVQPYTF